MKRTLQSSESIFSCDAVSEPHTPAAHTPEPHASNPYDSWSMLVSDMQNIIVALLDRGTRQCLALTSKEHYKLWNDSNLCGEWYMIVEYLAYDAPVVYLKQGLEHYQNSRHYNAYSSLHWISKSTRSDLIPLLEDVLDKDYLKYGILEANDFEHLLLLLIKENNFDILCWMPNQPWFKLEFFSASVINDVRLALAKNGHVAITNFFLDELAVFADHIDIRLELVMVNAIHIDAIPYNWALLFSSTPDWITWWRNWRTNLDPRGFLGKLGELFHYGTNVAGFVIKHIHEIWSDLDETLKSQIILLGGNSSVARISYREAVANSSVALLNMLCTIGFPITPNLSTWFFSSTLLSDRTHTYDFFERISEDRTSDVMEWMWKHNLIEFPLDEDVKFRLWQQAGNFVHACNNTRIRRAVTWIKEHPFKHSSNILELLCSSVRFITRYSDEEIARLMG